ncbi:hypothetical protein PM082_006734 [Marasmius tenuissimus]|nr:hypothetical protein PM082_006734 [Marasmius tenuissimus]
MRLDVTLCSHYSLTSFLIASGCTQTLTYLTLKKIPIQRELFSKLLRFTPYLRPMALEESEFLEGRIPMVKSYSSILCLPIIPSSVHTDIVFPDLEDCPTKVQKSSHVPGSFKTRREALFSRYNPPSRFQVREEEKTSLKSSQ